MVIEQIKEFRAIKNKSKIKLAWYIFL